LQHLNNNKLSIQSTPMMDAAMKRIISGEDMNDDNRPLSMDAEEVDDPNSMTTAGAGPTSPALVENDMDIDMNDVRHNIASMTDTPRSSVSDMSDVGGQDDNDVEHRYEQDRHIYVSEAAKHPMHRRIIQDERIVNIGGAVNIPRNDSKVSSSDSSNSMRGSSQNSSRDWGWFEDVHASEHANNSSPHQLHKRKSTDEKHKHKKHGKNRHGGGGLGTVGLPNRDNNGTLPAFCVACLWSWMTRSSTSHILFLRV
jgi:hypothetical protein